jgi:hypothetical protein
MIEEDKNYMKDILKVFDVENFKLSETERRFKLIFKPKVSFSMDKLHEIQTIRGPVGVEVDMENGLYLECLKSGFSRKKRRIALELFEDKIPKKYDVGKFNKAMREILSMQDLCEFEVNLKEKEVELKHLERVSYPVLKRIESHGFSVEIDMVKSILTLRI